MNKLKPEHVMKALELCKIQLSAVCKICQYREYGASCHTKLNVDALALLREKDARIEHLERTMRESILSNTELLENLNKLVEEKDAEIKELKNYYKSAFMELKQLWSNGHGSIDYDDLHKIEEEYFKECYEG